MVQLQQPDGERIVVEFGCRWQTASTKTHLWTPCDSDILMTVADFTCNKYSFLWSVKGFRQSLERKLLSAGRHGKIYKWLSDFLFNITARVKVDGMISGPVKLREGVPQGDVVSPTLFLVYMNDVTTTMPRHVSNTLKADDFALWCTKRTHHHSCPLYLEHYQWGVQLDSELGTTAQHNPDDQYTLHIVHSKGEGLTKI